MKILACASTIANKICYAMLMLFGIKNCKIRKMRKFRCLISYAESFFVIPISSKTTDIEGFGIQKCIEKYNFVCLTHFFLLLKIKNQEKLGNFVI